MDSFQKFGLLIHRVAWAGPGRGVTGSSATALAVASLYEASAGDESITGSGLTEHRVPSGGRRSSRLSGGLSQSWLALRATANIFPLLNTHWSLRPLRAHPGAGRSTIPSCPPSTRLLTTLHHREVPHSGPTAHHRPSEYPSPVSSQPEQKVGVRTRRQNCTGTPCFWLEGRKGERLKPWKRADVK